MLAVTCVQTGGEHLGAYGEIGQPELLALGTRFPGTRVDAFRVTASGDEHRREPRLGRHRRLRQASSRRGERRRARLALRLDVRGEVRARLDPESEREAA